METLIFIQPICRNDQGVQYEIPDRSLAKTLNPTLDIIVNSIWLIASMDVLFIPKYLQFEITMAILTK